VVVWGQGQRDLHGQTQIVDDVEFISGRALRRWLGQPSTNALTKEQAEHVLGELREFKARVDPARRVGRS
jgi:hypothetical protein